MVRVLGLDVGDRRIGVALSDPSGTIASSLPAIQRVGPRKDVQAILRLIAEHKVERIVVGLPLLMSGEAGEQAEKVGGFAEALRARTKVPIEYRDERLSTVAAYQIMEETGVKRSARRGKVDSVAAAVVLQEYLDRVIHQASTSLESGDQDQP